MILHFVMNSPKDLPPLGDWVKAWAKRYGHTDAMQQEFYEMPGNELLAPRWPPAPWRFVGTGEALFGSV